jgi:hypothetical protein
VVYTFCHDHGAPGGRVSPPPGALLAASIASTLATGRPTYFAFEGACRHGLRAGLCLDGWRWPQADATAEGIVAAALQRIGASRPTWEQGQPEYTEPHASRCLRCRRVITEDDRRKYCSDLCRRAHQQWRYAKDHRAEARATSQAWRDARRAAATAKPCAQCGRLFKPLQEANRPAPRFCGKSCAASWSNARRKSETA